MIPGLTAEEVELLELHSTLKLQIELVPGSSWWNNVRSNVRKRAWDLIRFKTYEEAKFVCEICGEAGTKHPVECHEIWMFNDQELTQMLERFQALCPLCHEVKHMGFASVRGNRERAFNRFIALNNLQEETADRIKDAIFKQWQIRSEDKWTILLDKLTEYSIVPEKWEEDE